MARPGPRLAMVMIARDEEENVVPCFESFWDDVDEVVLCDTGSVDDTVAVARRYAEGRGEPDKLVLGQFEWCDDFAAARNYADSLTSADWVCWMDLDETLVGGEHLRCLVTEASEGSHEIDGNCRVSFQWKFDREHFALGWTIRERLVPNDGRFPWVHRYYEGRSAPPGARDVAVLASIVPVYWNHHGGQRGDPSHYRRLIDMWVKEEPDCAFAHRCLAVDLLERCGEHEQAAAACQRALELPGLLSWTRQLVWRDYARALSGLERWDEVLEVGLAAHAEAPTWNEHALTVAGAYASRGVQEGSEDDLRRAVEFADLTIQLPPPIVPFEIDPDACRSDALRIKEVALAVLAGLASDTPDAIRRHQAQRERGGGRADRA